MISPSQLSVPDARMVELQENGCTRTLCRYGPLVYWPLHPSTRGYRPCANPSAQCHGDSMFIQCALPVVVRFTVYARY